MGVVNFISSWLKDIVVLFILIFIAELIMPKGNMKRYIDLVIGLLIIIAIISPFAKLMNYDFNINNIRDNYIKTEEIEGDLENNFYIEQEGQIERLFKDKLKNQVIHLIEESWDYEVLSVEIELEKTKDEYENIKLMRISLDKKEKEENTEEDISIEKVPKVEINTKEENKSSSLQEEEPKGYDEIRDLIANKLSIDIEKIIVE